MHHAKGPDTTAIVNTNHGQKKDGKYRSKSVNNTH